MLHRLAVLTRTVSSRPARNHAAVGHRRIIDLDCVGLWTRS